MSARRKVSVERGSEETFEFICTWCKETKIVEAQKYCGECDEHYCLVCADLHKRVPALKCHVILDRGHVRIWGTQSKTPTIFTETCDRHPGKLVELFCGEHKELCCHICVSLYHRTCEDMLYVEEAAMGISESKEIKAINEILENIKTNIEKKITKQQVPLKYSESQVFKQIASFRNHANEIFDDLEKKITDEMDLLAKDSSSRHNAYQKACNEILIEIQHHQKQLESTRYVNDSQTFINLKKCKFLIPKMHKATNELPVQNADDKLLFEVNSKLESFMDNLNCLGTVTLMSQTVKPLSTNQITSGNIASSKVSLKEVGHLQVSRYEKYNIKMRCDNQQCGITSICQMPDGSILLADFYNSNIKLLDSSYQLIDYFEMPTTPTQICPINDHNVVVASSDNFLTLITVGKHKVKYCNTQT